MLLLSIKNKSHVGSSQLSVEKVNKMKNLVMSVKNLQFLS